MANRAIQDNILEEGILLLFIFLKNHGKNIQKLFYSYHQTKKYFLPHAPRPSLLAIFLFSLNTNNLLHHLYK